MSNGDTIHTYIEDTTGTSENYETVFYRAEREPDSPTEAFIFVNSTVIGFHIIDLNEHRKSLPKHSKFKSLSKDPTTVYFNYEDAINYLNTEEKNLLRYINNYLRKDSFSFNISRQIAQKEFRRFATLLYSLGKEGKLPAYDNDSLASTLDSAAIIYKAADKIFEFEYPDSTRKWQAVEKVTIIRQFSPDSIRRIMLMDVWETTGPFEAQCKLWAVAPTYSHVAAGLILAPSSWFWLTWRGVSPFFTSEEKEFYNYFLYDHQKNKANLECDRDYLYWEKTFFWEDGY